MKPGAQRASLRAKVSSGKKVKKRARTVFTRSAEENLLLQRIERVVGIRIVRGGREGRKA